MWGGIEAGGTKFVCVVGSGPHSILEEVRFPTTTPDETITRTVTFFEGQQAQHGPLQAIGIGSFGPLDLQPSSPRFGYITTTPKPGWAQTDIVGTVTQALGLPVGFDTDVNAAALGEYRWGAAQGLDTFVYLTIGTGIGGGGLINGKPAHGLLHPEIGHMYVPHKQDDPFPGACPFHADCLEGLAAGPAIEQRWGKTGAALAENHPAWPLEAYYLALGIANVIFTLSPQRIIVGGGVMQQQLLFPLIRRNVQEMINGYVKHAAILDDIEQYIVPPVLGDQAGVLGALALAQQIAEG